MKTVEFKLNLNQSQQVRIDTWLKSLRWVWNKGLSLLEDFHRFQAWDKHSKAWVACCPVGWEYRRDGDVWVPFSRCSDSRKDYKQCCPIRQDWRSQPIESPSYFGVLYYFAQKNHPDKPWFTDIPSKFVAGTVKALTDAWQQYLKGKRKHPKYKGKRDEIDTLVNANAKDIKVKSKYPASEGELTPVESHKSETLKQEPEKSGLCSDAASACSTRKGRYINIPKLGQVNVKTLEQRWSCNTPISVLKICKRPSGYYLQLTGEVKRDVAKPSNKACGLDVGLQYIYADDAGKVVEPPKYYRTAQKRLRRLQRKVARQQNGSASRQKTYQKIARCHENIRASRRSFNHKLSTYLVRVYGALAVEDIQIANLTRRPKPKVRQDGKGYERNGAKAKSGLNKSFADAGLGQLLALIEQKAKVAEREFVRVQPHYTSQDCPECGHRQKKALSQRTHLCSECGYTAQRDVAAAINIRAKADFARIYPTSVGKVKPVEPDKVQAMKQEPSSEGLSSDAGATPKLPQKSKKRSAHSPTGIQMELDLWGSALAKSFEPG